MRDILLELVDWQAEEEKIALATVIQTWGSSPRGVGAKMAMTPTGKIAGSVSGGCVEGAVYETGMEVLKTSRPQLLHFGVADETAWEVGLACGGQIDIFVNPLDKEFFERLRIELLGNRPFSVATIVNGPSELLGREMLIDGDRIKGYLDPELADILLKKSLIASAHGVSGRFDVDWKDESLQIFVEVVKSPPTLVVVGGVHIAIPLTSIAKALGYETVVVDPRQAFGNLERFPHVDRLIQSWPEQAFTEIELTGETAVAMLTHDPKIDDPALKVVLKSPAFYVGALGSLKTQEKRRQRLLEGGLTEEQLDRLHGPIGLKIGGERPEEIALAIMAEVIATRHR